MKQMLAKQLINFKTSAKSLMSNKLFYVLVFLTILVIPTLFFDWAVYILFGMILVTVAILPFEMGLSILLYFYFFNLLFRVNDVPLYTVCFMISTSILLFKHYLQVILKNEKADFKLILMILLAVIYTSLPIRGNSLGFSSISLLSIFYLIMFLSLIYLIYINRTKIDFLKVIQIVAIGALVAAVFGACYWISPRLQSLREWKTFSGSNVVRYNALFMNPNTLAGITLFVLAAVVYLIYSEKLKLFGYVLFSGVFVLGYSTLSRQFLYAAIILVSIFTVAEIIKNKKQFYKKVIPILSICAVVALLCFPMTKVQINRFSFKDLVQNYEGVTNIETQDPGRAGLFKLYFTDWTSNALTLFFGRGIMTEYLGVGLAPHNSFLEAFWMLGIVGVLVIVAIVLMFMSKFSQKSIWNSVKNAFKNPVTYILVIPCFAIMFVDCLFMNLHMYIAVTVMLVTICANCKCANNKEAVTENIETIEENEQKKI